MLEYTLAKIAEIIDTRLTGSEDLPAIRYFSTDSRKILNTHHTLFIAMSGKNTDGHSFIQDAYDKGVRQFITHRMPGKRLPDCGYLIVDEPLNALQKIAVHHRQRYSLPVIGITGSNGKTIIKEWLYQLLHLDYNVCRSPKSYNSQLGVPLSVLQLETAHNLAIFEAGISTTDEMDKLEKIIRPTIGIFTNIGPAHDAGFLNSTEKVREKMKLFQNCEKLIFCSDYTRIAENAPLGVQTVSWGSKIQDNYKVRFSKEEKNRTKIFIQNSNQEWEFDIPFSDDAYAEGCVHCIVLMLELGYEAKDIADRISNLRPLAMRMELKYGLNNCTIIDDSYSADLLSLKAALEFFRQQESSKKRTLIISDFEQSGLDDTRLIDELIKIIRINKFQKVITVGNLFLKNIDKLNKLKLELHCFPSTEALLTQLDGIGFKDEVILIKGARQFQFEQVSYRLLGQSHTTILEINLNALADNFDVFKSHLKKNTGIIPMVKAFSYGSGSTEIATMLEEKGVDYFAVAYADEGVKLREGGVKTRIIVMNPSPRDFEKMVRYHLEPEIYHISMLKNLHTFLQANEYSTYYPIHIKIETGMNRLGFQEKSVSALIAELKYHDLVRVATVFSHLAASDEPQMDKFTIKQLEQFERISSDLAKELGYEIKRHILNSSGILRFPKYQYDYVRLGIGLYGVDSSHTIQSQLVTIGTLKTSVSQVKLLEKEETVGYGRKGVLQHKTKIAVIAIGYADGFDRRFSNGIGEVFIRGKKAPVIGNVCMDMCMVDVTHIPNVSEGDEVEVYGKNISVIEAAQKIGTIPYELLTKISRRVRRVYYWN